MELVCLTHGRAGLITTHRVFGEELILSVTESQVADYRAAYPDAKIDPHPDDVVGLPAKKNHVAKKYGSVFMLDDDVHRISDLTGNQSKIEPKTAVALVRRLADQASEMGASLFGFTGDANPMHFQPQQPFALTGLLDGGKFGVIDFDSSNVWWPDDPTYGLCEDMWACGLNAYANRYLLKDLRYALVGPTETQDLTGGLAATRTKQAMNRCADMLVETFGDAVELKDREKATKYFWRLRVPW